MISLTVLILTYNEKENIARTLGELSSVEKVVLIDSFSTDGTIQIAQSAHRNVQVLQRAFDTHTQQWNFGLDQIATEWVLTLDADYQVSPELAAEIAGLQPQPDITGYSADFQYRIFGHPLRASSYPPRIVLFKPTTARYVDDGHTQTLWIKTASQELRPPGMSGRVGKLSGKIYHDDRKSLSHWVRAQDRYATIEARHLVALPLDQLSSQDRLRRKIFFAAPAMFLYLLFGRGLILDGWPGWFYVAQRTIAELLLSIRLLIEAKKLEDGS
jgi:glycosyltransferase involved in cell wall biosynthesis